MNLKTIYLAFCGIGGVLPCWELVPWVTAHGRGGNIRRLWLPMIALFVVGVSLALPLFLHLRESALGNGRRVQAVRA